MSGSPTPAGQSPQSRPSALRLSSKRASRAMQQAARHLETQQAAGGVPPVARLQPRITMIFVIQSILNRLALLHFHSHLRHTAAFWSAPEAYL